jgi:hypothetical protein
MKLKFELVNGYGILVDGDLFPELKILFAEKELGFDVPVFEWRDFEVEKLAEESPEGYHDYKSQKIFKEGFITGYKSNPAKFTEEDIEKSIAFGMHLESQPLLQSAIDEEVKGFIQSLQKYPQYIVMESDVMNKDYTDESDKPYQECEIPRIFTNSEGKKQGIVKELIWES